MCSHSEHYGLTHKCDMGKKVVASVTKTKSLARNLRSTEYLLAGVDIIEIGCATRSEGCSRRAQAKQNRASINVESHKRRLISILLEARNKAILPKVALQFFVLITRKGLVNKG